MSSGKQDTQNASIHRAHENAWLTSFVYYKILSTSRTFLPPNSFIKRSQKHEVYLPDLSTDQNKDHISVWFHATWHEPPHDKINKMTCAPSEDSDKPGHPLSLISLRCPHDETLGPQLMLLPNERTAKTLNRLDGCPGWSEYSLGEHVILLVLSCGGSYIVV